MLRSTLDYGRLPVICHCWLRVFTTLLLAVRLLPFFLTVSLPPFGIVTAISAYYRAAEEHAN